MMEGKSINETGKLRPLVESDKPTEMLLQRIADHVVYDYLSKIATSTGMHDAKLSTIRADNPGMSNYQIFQVGKHNLVQLSGLQTSTIFYLF